MASCSSSSSNTQLGGMLAILVTSAREVAEGCFPKGECCAITVSDTALQRCGLYDQ
jgi:hypothetical protein